MDGRMAEALEVVPLVHAAAASGCFDEVCPEHQLAEAMAASGPSFVRSPRLPLTGDEPNACRTDCKKGAGDAARVAMMPDWTLAKSPGMLW